MVVFLLALAATMSQAMTGPSLPAETAFAAPANAAGALGLYPATDFSVALGSASAQLSSRQAAWYFRAETIAVPRPGRPVAGFETGVRAFADVRHWSDRRAVDASIDFPPLVWVAAPQIVRHAHLAEGGQVLAAPGGSLPFQVVPKIALNRSYYDASSVSFFQSRALTVRGATTPGGFVARSIWPEDFRFGKEAPDARALPAGPPAEALRALMREEPRGGAGSPFSSATLWQRPGTPSDWAGRPVLALMVNGAQGDDDEAQGGHFAIVTGRVQADGDIGDWIVNNFYSLDIESEKGILAAPVPLNNYLGDLNAGQGWYRPSYMVVAVLRDERAAALVQSALNRVYHQFYRHQLVYYHPNQNCASISVDTLRALGWDVPGRGPSSRVLAWVGYPYFALKEMSIDKARMAFDYLRTDQTRLMPAAALEEAFASLLAMASTGAPRQDGVLAKMLAQDLSALAFIRFPQFPSSRAFGDAPAVSTWEYQARLPKDPALAQIVPVPPRAFPADLRDGDLLSAPWTPSDYATLVWSTVCLAGLALLLRWRWRARRRRLAEVNPAG